MNQTEFAALAGVRKRAQINYEAGERAPDANYLAAIAAAGADVAYILTGEPAGTASNAKTLSHSPEGKVLLEVTIQEKAHIENLRECEKEDRDAIGRMALRSAKAQHTDVSDKTKRKKAQP